MTRLVLKECRKPRTTQTSLPRSSILSTRVHILAGFKLAIHTPKMHLKILTLFLIATFIGLCVGTPVDITGASELVSRDGIYLPSCGCFNDCLIKCYKEGGYCGNCPYNCGEHFYPYLRKLEY